LLAEDGRAARVVVVAGSARRRRWCPGRKSQKINRYCFEKDEELTTRRDYRKTKELCGPKEKLNGFSVLLRREAS